MVFLALEPESYSCCMRYVLLAMFLISIGSVKGEEIPHPELLNLFESDLVVDANFKSQDNSRFYIIVNETIKDHGYGIKKGDQINLQREDNGCGGIVDFSYYKRRRYYLKKTLKGWRLNYASTQSIKSVYQFGELRVDDRYCGLSFVPPHGTEKKTMNETIREFARTYQFNRDEWEYVPLVDSATLMALVQKNIMIAAFEERGRCCIGDHDDSLMEPVQDPVVEMIEEEPTIVNCGFMVKDAENPFTTLELRNYLHIYDYPHKETGIEGRVILQLTISDSGLVKEVDVKRGLYPALDSIAIQKAFDMPPWQPAEDRRGQKQSCHTILPFTFRLNE